ncbi:MAG: hypothetical protein HY718_02935 [Planctomycetes bacterium]|nr:hypothetical protein [Planctomycetota bacterium]
MRYIQETLGLDLHPVPWAGQARLPFLLRDRYRCYRVEILDAACLLMMDAGDEEQSPATIRKHMENLQAHAGGLVIYVRERVTGYNRKRLIEHKVPFVIPGNQMYLPMLGIDLREHFVKLRSQPAEFSPSAQVVVIYWLLSGKDEVLTPSAMAERLKYSPMTMTRAFNELEETRLGKFTTRGRERCVVFSAPKRELWLKAQPFLRSPVRRRHHVRTSYVPGPGVRAGLTALAQYTMLAEPARPVFAVRGREWARIRPHHEAHLVPAQEPQATEIEIWSYDPSLFAENGLADRLSLYLSLKGSQDERVEAALEEMLERLRW